MYVYMYVQYVYMYVLYVSIYVCTVCMYVCMYPYMYVQYVCMYVLHVSTYVCTVYICMAIMYVYKYACMYGAGLFRMQRVTEAINQKGIAKCLWSTADPLVRGVNRNPNSTSRLHVECGEWQVLFRQGCFVIMSYSRTERKDQATTKWPKIFRDLKSIFGC